VEAGDSPEAEPPYVPFVYRLDGTDDATRAQIAAALEAKALGGTLSVLYDDPKAGYRSDEVDPAQVLLAKANLSTTSQPAGLTAPLRLAAMGAELGPTAANLGQVSDFALMLWELSVVQAGGFYLRYETRDGKGLPEEIFHSAGELPEGEDPTGDTAELTLAITFPAGTAVSSWHNAFVVSLPSDFKDTLYVGLADTGGKALQTLHPSYPPGCVGFDGTWNESHLLASDVGGTLYAEDWVGQLYHQLQFEVAGAKPGTPVKFGSSPWSLSLSPVSEGGDGLSDLYRQVLPAYRFVEGAGEEPNPYGAVGGTVQLAFRVGDVFGNVLESGGREGSFPLLYNDPLIGPGEWPGVRVAHRFVPGEGEKGPRLRLSFAFDPQAVVTPGEGQEDPHAAAEQAKAALGRYATAIAQLQDPRTEALLATSIPGLLGSLGPINKELLKYAEEIAEQLAKVVAGGKAEAVSSPLEWPIEPKQLAQAESDLAALTVCLEMKRPEDLIYRGADGSAVEKADCSSFPVPADLSPREKQVADGDLGLLDEAAPDVGLLPYAEDFEEVFAGWDGASGLARLAARHDREDLAAKDSTPPLWVVRMAAGDPNAGIDVKFEGEGASYFSLAPLSVELVNEKALVPVYDEKLERQADREQAFTGIDLDQWGEAFLAAVDEVLSPAIGTAMALADVKAYEELMGAKADLAAALAKGVQPVFVAEDEKGIEDAREAFEQSLLAKLASAFTV
ncbi:MAG: hypothetical protein M3335_11720, partial [Actinomycetota bacterium]|nr:hypothetical protein [Actinomycetota bacterium]